MSERDRHVQRLRDLAAPPHRAISNLRLPLPRLAGGALIALAFTLVLVGAMPTVARLWSRELLWWMALLELPGDYAGASLDGADVLSLPVPLVDVRLPALSPAMLATHGLATLAVWWIAGWLPDAAKPAAYLLRFAALLHGVAVVYFFGWPASFQHSVMGHVAGGLRQAWALMLFTPWLHFFTFYLFPFAGWQDALLTALTVLYLAVLAPLQYATHAALLYLCGPVLMPLLHLLFGVMVPILAIVALYGWGMSWRARPPAGTKV